MAAAAAAGTSDPICAVADLVQQMQQLPKARLCCIDSCICGDLPAAVQGVTDWESAWAAAAADRDLQQLVTSLPGLAARLLQEQHSHDSFPEALRLYTRYVL